VFSGFERPFCGLFYLSSLLAAATSAFALAWCHSGEWLWLFLALATAQRQQLLSRDCAAAGQLPIFRPLCSSSSCYLAPELQQLQQHDGDIRRLRISSSSFYLRMRSYSSAWCDIVHDGDDVDDGGVELKCSSMV
jgi:hypothetical protein